MANQHEMNGTKNRGLDKRYLLNDEAMQDFIINGYLVVKPDLPPDYHQSVFRQCSEILAQEEHPPGNDLLPKIPMLQKVFDDPVVSGALASILGTNYIMHQHRVCHYHPPGSKAQNWHKDYPLGGNVRCHRVRLAMAFYYPQDVTEDMGPTAIQPGTQYYVDPAAEIPGLALCGEAGTVTIVHYELWHRATQNRSDKTRFMLKFLFCRTEEPQGPSWDAENPVWEFERAAALPKNPGPNRDQCGHRVIWGHLWHWYWGRQNGHARVAPSPRCDDMAAALQALRDEDASVRQCAADALGSIARAAEEVIAALQKALRDANEAVRLNATYALAAIGEPAVPALIEALREESEATWKRNLNRNDFTNPSQLDAPYGLAAIGEPAVPALSAELGARDWWVRAAAANALGCMGRAAEAAVPALLGALKDESEWVRRNAADTLGNIGDFPSPLEAAAALGEALGDERPVSPWSLSGQPFRENAAAALAKMNQCPQGVVPALIKASGAENEYIRFWTSMALEDVRKG